MAEYNAGIVPSLMHRVPEISEIARIACIIYQASITSYRPQSEYAFSASIDLFAVPLAYRIGWDSTVKALSQRHAAGMLPGNDRYTHHVNGTNR